MPALILESCGGWLLAPERSGLSRPMIGTICVSLLKGPTAAMPKCGANVGMRAIGQSSFTSFFSIFPVFESFTRTLPPIPRSRSHQVSFRPPPYGATPSCTYPALVCSFGMGFNFAVKASTCPATIPTPFPGLYSLPIANAISALPFRVV